MSILLPRNDSQTMQNLLILGDAASTIIRKVPFGTKTTTPLCGPHQHVKYLVS